MMRSIGKASLDLIVSEEVSSREVYEKKYRRPEWPGAQSGVTIGIGYDVGQNSVRQFREDWSGVIPDAMVDALADTCGITGESARWHAQRLRDVVDVPWDAAVSVFEKRSLPRYLALTIRALPNTDKLPPDCLGVLVSLVFNRGASFGMEGARYAEMRAIKGYMEAGAFHRIPDELRSMKRLWPDLPGLLRRRDREAALFEKTWREAAADQAPTKPAPAPSPPPPPPPAPPVITPDRKPGIAEKIADALASLFGRKKK